MLGSISSFVNSAEDIYTWLQESVVSGLWKDPVCGNGLCEAPSEVKGKTTCVQHTAAHCSSLSAGKDFKLLIAMGRSFSMAAKWIVGVYPASKFDA